jgi:hypothetical protein
VKRVLATLLKGRVRQLERVAYDVAEERHGAAVYREADRISDLVALEPDKVVAHI